MSKDLNYGYKQPTDGDESKNQWMPDIENNWARMVEHRHDGDDSRLLDSININKDTIQVTSGKLSATGLSYNIGSATADVGSISVTAGMYCYGDDLALRTEVSSVSGSTVNLSSDFTASATGTGALDFSTYKKVDTSLFEKTISLPSGYVAKDYHYKFYISSTGDYQYNSITPTIVDTDTNTMSFQINDDAYDIVVSLM